jgi:folate-binding protein YgfZ
MNAPGAPAPVDDQYEAARSAAAVHVIPRDVVSVSGADAEPYLQGQCSQDVAGLPPGSTVDSLLLSPQGKIDAFIRVNRSEDGGFVIDTDPGSGPVVVARLERYRLRMKVDIDRLDSWACVAVRGPGASDAVFGSPPFVLPVEWPGLIGLDLLGAAPPDLSSWVDREAVPCGEEAWEALRIEAGIPVGGRDAVEGSIPAEAGLVERTVSFTKGCYTGQELVARLDARGSKVARRLRGVVASTVVGGDGTGGLPAVGSVVLTADGGHEVGQLTSVAWSPGLRAAVALAMLHRRVEPPEPVLLQSAPGQETRPAEARPLPLFA